MARAIVQGFAEQGGYKIVTDGRVSTTTAQRSFPGCQVDVFLAGTSTPASIFSDVGGTPKANPFVASADGYWFFWADDGSYDVRFSGAGITTPFTLFNFVIGQSGALNDPGSNGILARTAANTVTPRTITGVTNETLVTNGNGVAGNPTIGLATFLEFTGRTLNGGMYLSPGIASFASAQHSHGDAVGGGQMNASNVFSTGTVPVARLPLMVGATGVTPGVAGLVPAPAAGDDDLFLRGDGTWQAAGGGGGGTPASPNLSLQYNNAGAFGGVTGTSSDGTQVTWTDGVLRATSPRITTNIKDSNGNAIITLNAVGTSVNNLQIANAAAGGVPGIAAIGTDANISISLTPKGTGVVSTPANVTISNLAPQITLIDTNDSKQARLLLSGSNLSLINDTLGSTPLNIDTTNNTTTFVGNLVINNANPAITFDDTAGTDAKIDHEASVLRFGSTVANQVTLDVSTGIMNFTQIPTMPTTTPTTTNQVVSKNTLDNALLPFSINFFEFDPSASTVAVDDRPRFIVPDNVVGGTITKAMISFGQGSALAGGSTIVFTFRRWTAAGAFSDWATATMTSSHAQNVTTVFDITDQGLNASDAITYYIASRSGSGINPRGLTLSLQGTWKRVNP